MNTATDKRCDECGTYNNEDAIYCVACFNHLLVTLEPDTDDSLILAKKAPHSVCGTPYPFK